MPGKNRRIASRQGELSRRKKRQQRGPSGIPTDVATPEPQNPTNGSVATTTRNEARPTQAPEAPLRPASTNYSRSQAPRPRADTQLLQQYIGPELRRILIFGGVGIAILVGVGFVF